MRHALILAGGSGTRLWPMSRKALPKQLVPMIGGRSLLQLAMTRLDGLVPPERRFVCAGVVHRDAVVDTLPGLPPANYLGEPTGRDTLNAVGWSAIEIGRRDPEAVIAVFTADHLIEPIDVFQRAVDEGFRVAEEGVVVGGARAAEALVTFGIEPTHAATAYGYLELGAPLGGTTRRVDRFQEKPDRATAEAYAAAGPARYLWNSGMFVWRARTLLRAIRSFAPHHAAGLAQLEIDDPVARGEALARVYPTLGKISIDYALMEPASRSDTLPVVAVPMPVSWMDVGSWPALGETCPHDAHGNALQATRCALMETSGTLVASSDPAHAIAVLGCEGLIIVHTPDATLVCRRDRAEDVKRLHAMVAERFGSDLL
jgi:mannose-1-phosphate guanylyltransferase